VGGRQRGLGRPRPTGPARSRSGHSSARRSRQTLASITRKALALDPERPLAVPPPAMADGPRGDSPAGRRGGSAGVRRPRPVSRPGATMVSATARPNPSGISLRPRRLRRRRFRAEARVAAPITGATRHWPVRRSWTRTRRTSPLVWIAGVIAVAPARGRRVPRLPAGIGGRTPASSRSPCRTSSVSTRPRQPAGHGPRADPHPDRRASSDQPEARSCPGPAAGHEGRHGHAIKITVATGPGTRAGPGPQEQGRVVGAPGDRRTPG
jgi:hypothetical protein